MALRAKKPHSIQKRLKALFYGVAGSGKTTACLSFPTPYLIDCERGAENDQYVELLEKNGGALFQTTDFKDIIIEIKELISTSHPYKTLVIDPLTVIYNNLLDKYALDKDIGSGFGRHYSAAAKDMKRLFDLLLRLDMNVIITSHSKNEYGDDLVVLGQTFDCYKKLDYLFDLVLEIQKRGKERIGIIKKTRLTNFIESESFPFTYINFAQKYGKNSLEKDAIPQEIATLDQINEIERLIKELQIPEEYIDKKLKEANSSTFEEMPRELIEKWINHLKLKEIKE